MSNTEGEMCNFFHFQVLKKCVLECNWRPNIFFLEIRYLIGIYDHFAGA